VSLAVDANLLLFASDRASPRHERARAAIDQLVAGPRIVYMFWPVLMAYVRIATHPTLFVHPVDPEVARRNVGSFLALPHVAAPGEGEGFWSHFVAVAEDADPRGNLVSDAHLVALMRQHGVRTLWSNDRDFRRFSDIEVHDPFA